MFFLFLDNNKKHHIENIMLFKEKYQENTDRNYR